MESVVNIVACALTTRHVTLCRGHVTVRLDGPGLPVIKVDQILKPLTPTVVIWVQLIKHPVPDWFKPSFVIFDIRAL